MLQALSKSKKEELKQLWGGGQVPSLTIEQTELSLKLWRKIKKRKGQEQQLTLQQNLSNN
jgi:hypothetical protein